MVNGHDFAGAPLIGQKPQRKAFDFDSTLVQRVAAHAKTQLENAGGAMPMVDPVGFLTAALLLEKVNDLKKQMDELTAIVKAQPATRPPAP